jgi:hypothetical protein
MLHTPTQRWLVFTGTALVCAGVLAAYRLAPPSWWQGWPFQQSFQPVVLTPATPAVAERARGGLVKLGVLTSATATISASIGEIPFGQDPDLSAVTSGKAAMLRLENPEFCEAGGACEHVLISASGDASLFKDFVLMTGATSIAVGTTKVAGNPDLLVSYGPGVPPVHLRWRNDDAYPRYVPLEQLPPELR